MSVYYSEGLMRVSSHKTTIPYEVQESMNTGYVYTWTREEVRKVNHLVVNGIDLKIAINTIANERNRNSHSKVQHA